MDLIEIFQQYPAPFLLIAAIAVMLIFRTVVEFINWCKKTFIKPAIAENNSQVCFEARLEKCENDIKTLSQTQKQQGEDIKKLTEGLEKLSELNKDTQNNIIALSAIVKEQGENIKKLNTDVELLLSSDKAAIKAWITRYHHKLMEQGWVDDYSLESIEGRYQHYLSEHGNSFVGDLMQDIRALPHTPPAQNK